MSGNRLNTRGVFIYYVDLVRVDGSRSACCQNAGRAIEVTRYCRWGRDYYRYFSVALLFD